MPVLSETFTISDTTTLSGNTIFEDGPSDGGQVVGQRFRALTVSNPSRTRTASSLGTIDQYIEQDAVWNSVTSDHEVQILMRFDPTADTGYGFTMLGSGQVRLDRFSAGAFTQIGITTFSFSPGTHRMRGEVDGSSLTGKIAGTTRIGPTTDTNIGAGNRAGLACYSVSDVSAVEIDNWTAGPLYNHNWVATGTALSGNAGTTTVAIPYPTPVAAGERCFAVRSVKPETATAVDEAGWTALINATGGTGTTGLDTGLTRLKVDYKDLDGSESGSVTFDQGATPNAVAGQMISYAVEAGYDFDVMTTSSGQDANHNVGRAVTGTTTLAIAPGDLIIAFCSSDTDATTAFTSPAITATGITFGTTVQRQGASGVSQNNDCGHMIYEARAKSGTGTSNPILNLSGGPSNCGVVGFVRLRSIAEAAPAVQKGRWGLKAA